MEFDTVDKSGGFVGALYLNKTENAAITLVTEGLAYVHEYSAETLAWSHQLYDTEVGVILVAVETGLTSHIVHSGIRQG